MADWIKRDSACWIKNDSAVCRDAEAIIRRALDAVLPDEAVRRALAGRAFARPVTLFAIGKAGWRMARAAYDALGAKGVARGVVITKYGHAEGAIGPLEIYEAGHPVPDENGVAATCRALDMARALTAEDTALLLLSGGGSALFECPAQGVTLPDIADVTGQLLACGAEIREINCIRKRLSGVKGGRFALACAPAQVLSIILSDVLGDAPDVIASGPASPDPSTCAEARAIAQKYALRFSGACGKALERETPKALQGVETVVSGNVRALCEAAAEAARALGYRAEIRDAALACEAREAGRRLAREARAAQPPCALIYGGETVVHLRGRGKGGRNQECALAAAEDIRGLADACVLALGSDGTDGPTDAAGACVTGDFYDKAGARAIARALEENDSYPLLKARGALIMTGPTGTNVNDLYMLLRR